MNGHKTCDVAMKIISVDIEMAVIINWMNRHHEVFTIYSCQGNKEINDKAEETLTGCYVLWLCHDVPHDPQTLKSIIRKFKECGAKTKKERYAGLKRYYTTWPNKEAFKATRLMCLNEIKDMDTDTDRITRV